MNRSWDNTVIGRIVLTMRSLRVETNSTRRAHACLALARSSSYCFEDIEHHEARLPADQRLDLYRLRVALELKAETRLRGLASS